MDFETRKNRIHHRNGYSGVTVGAVVDRAYSNYFVFFVVRRFAEHARVVIDIVSMPAVFN